MVECLTRSLRSLFCSGPDLCLLWYVLRAFPSPVRPRHVMPRMNTGNPAQLDESFFRIVSPAGI